MPLDPEIFLVHLCSGYQAALDHKVVDGAGVSARVREGIQVRYLLDRVVFVVCIGAVMALGQQGSFTTNGEFAAFLSGVVLLKRVSNLTPARKALRYKELEHVTGITTERALTLLDGLRAEPQAMKRLLDAVPKVVTEVPVKTLP